MPRPIEMHAHDPRRYVGDMLAWVHQVCLLASPALTPLCTRKHLSALFPAVARI